MEERSGREREDKKRTTSSLVRCRHCQRGLKLSSAKQCSDCSGFFHKKCMASPFLCIDCHEFVSGEEYNPEMEEYVEENEDGNEDIQD